MSDPVFALLLLFTTLVVLALVRTFKTLDPRFGPAATTPLVVGVAAGLVLGFVPIPDRWFAVAAAVLLTAGALYVRLTGEESEPSEGMILGAVTGAGAAAALIVAGSDLVQLSAVVLAGAVAGFGITVGARQVANALRQIVIDLATACAAAGATMLPAIAIGAGAKVRPVAIASCALVPLLIIITVFVQWRDVKRELAEEERLGFVSVEDVRRTAHPFLRFGKGAWSDRAAHREFVRIATRTALRKRQQRSRSGELARLYQVEIMKLRMQMQEMTRLDRMNALGTPQPDEELASDTIDSRSEHRPARRS